MKRQVELKNRKSSKTTISIRLTKEQHDLLRRLCMVKHTTQSSYLAYLASDQARKELLDYAVTKYMNGKASLSELATETEFDVPTLMEAVAKCSSEDKRVIDNFLVAAKELSKIYKDPDFYESALRASSR